MNTSATRCAVMWIFIHKHIGKLSAFKISFWRFLDLNHLVALANSWCNEAIMGSRKKLKILIMSEMVERFGFDINIMKDNKKIHFFNLVLPKPDEQVRSYFSNH